MSLPPSRAVTSPAGQVPLWLEEPAPRPGAAGNTGHVPRFWPPLPCDPAQSMRVGGSPPHPCLGAHPPPGHLSTKQTKGGPTRLQDSLPPGEEQLLGQGWGFSGGITVLGRGQNSGPSAAADAVSSQLWIVVLERTRDTAAGLGCPTVLFSPWQEVGRAECERSCKRVAA